MGCSISCLYFEAFSSFLEWVVRKEAGWLVHYLDDILFLGTGGSAVCSISLHNLERQFGVPLAPEKNGGSFYDCYVFGDKSGYSGNGE